MQGCIILLIIAMVMIVVGVCLLKFTWHESGGAWLFFMGILVGLSILTIMICSPLTVKRDTNTFLQQKEYIENHIPNNEYEDAALTTKKIELNEWLIKAQYDYQYWRLFSFYDESIMELELIQ